jgi:hypothetical protein
MVRASPGKRADAAPLNRRIQGSSPCARTIEYAEIKEKIKADSSRCGHRSRMPVPRLGDRVRGIVDLPLKGPGRIAV